MTLPSGPFVSLDSIPVIHASIVLPFSGFWYADIVVSEPKPMTGTMTLSLAGVTFRCTAIRALDFAGARGVRVVGGAGGWRQILPPRQYGNTVFLTTVLNDAASAVGEQIVVAEDEQIGVNYFRVQGPAARVLNDRLGDRWHMDRLGVVQTAAWDPSIIASDFTATSVVGAAGQYTIATESVGDWMPGRMFQGPTAHGVISRVTHMVSKGQLRTVVLSE